MRVADTRLLVAQLETSGQQAGIARFDIDGYRLTYRQMGAGPAVVLIHGSISDYRAWSFQMEAFAGRYRAIAVSLRHSYPEAWDGQGPYSVDLHAEDVARLIAGIGAAPAHVVGHSRGGAVALRLALRHPDLVSALVLAEPGGLERLLPDTPEGHRMSTESVAMFAQLGRDLAAGDKEPAARNFVDSLGGAGAWERRPADARQVLLDNLATGPACAERPSYTPEEIAGISQPMLLLKSEHGPPRYGAMLAAMHKLNARTLPPVTIPNAGHSMHRDNPDAFNAAVLSFLAHPPRIPPNVDVEQPACLRAQEFSACPRP